MSLKKRLKSYTGNKVNLRSRHSFLRNLEGWYSIKLINKKTETLFKEYNSFNTTLKFTRWLCREKGFSSDEASIIGKEKTYSLKISCNFSDILRISETHHYGTCFSPRGSRRVNLIKILADPDMCLVFIPDKSGKFQWRCFLRLVIENNNSKNNSFALVAYKEYGNPSGSSILKSLSETIGLDIYKGYEYGKSLTSDFIDKTSPTIHNNSFVVPNYSDHPIFIKDKRLHIRVLENPVTKMIM